MASSRASLWAKNEARIISSRRCKKKAAGASRPRVTAGRDLSTGCSRETSLNCVAGVLAGLAYWRGYRVASAVVRRRVRSEQTDRLTRPRHVARRFRQPGRDASLVLRARRVERGMQQSALAGLPRGPGACARECQLGLSISILPRLLLRLPLEASERRSQALRGAPRDGPQFSR